MGKTSALQSGQVLQNGKYEIIRTLGQGGFGITYEAEQVLLRRTVAVKEFFMKDCCERDSITSHMTVGTGSQRALVEKFRGKFIREAQMIAGLDNPHIIKIHDIFEENGTAYYVMPFLDGGSLADKVKENGPMPEHEAIGYIKQIGNALDYLHKQNILHLDVKPSNVLLNAAGEAVLIDFGISKHYDEVGSQTSTTPVGISKGYAPMEQYQQGNVAKFSPATDIYSLGATLFNLLSGETPPEATEIYEDGLPVLTSVSKSTLRAIEWAMSPRRKDRPQSVSEWNTLLAASDIKASVIERDGTILPVVSEETIIPSFAPLPQQAYLEKSDRVFKVNDCSFKMVYVKGGKFLMGAVNTKHSQPDEKPVHQVTLRDFYIGETVVTKQLWSAVMGDTTNPYNLSDLDPMINVSYPECLSFITKLNSLCGASFRLPTEAEWEFAARGGENSNNTIYCGSDTLNFVASRGRLSPVKSKSPNEIGLYDMSGNVNEWCYDWYGKYEPQPQVDPQGPATGQARVARGGSYSNPDNYFRVSFRNLYDPATKSKNLGFRLAI